MSLRSAIAFAACLLLPAPALANGILEPVVAAPVIVEPAATDWTGGYVGGSLAYGAFQGTFCFEGAAGFSCADGVTVTGPQPEPSGALFGVTAGYDWQRGDFVFGIAGDYLLGDLSDEVGDAGGFTCAGGVCAIDVHSVAILRARVGYAGYDRFLPYASLGVAVSDVTVRTNFVGTPNALDDTATNVVVGLGAEYLATDSISIGLDFLSLIERPQHLGQGLENQQELGATDFGGNIVRLNVAYRF